ncbi:MULTISPECIES: hypothetical protein [Nocardiopsis]|uniref:Uncharacterized protein n=1 Tax=Nocardiopsis sinuspersici TaxID=501010 RepID=A0A1V3C659_9ACTN|nr:MULTISPECIES: hypothetical protein [Nocardiopsis]OOC56016.1 hypothetical protein NOSIN_21055 [Nocardiopsis sinuspersici]
MVPQPPQDSPYYPYPPSGFAVFRARNVIRAQNGPRASAYLVFGLLVLIGWLLFLVAAVALTESHGETLVYAGLGLLAAVGLTVLAAETTARSTRTVVGGDPLPPGTDPVRLLTAEESVKKGVLGWDPETNRLARILAGQKLREYGIRFPGRTSAFLASVACVQAVLLTWWLVTEGVSVDSVFLFFTLLGNALAALLHPPVAARDRRCAEALRAAYDHYATGPRHGFHRTYAAPGEQDRRDGRRRPSDGVPR